MPLTSLRARLADWLRRVLNHTGWSANRLAQECGFSGSNISRALDADETYILGTKHIDRIVEVTGLPAPFPTARDGFRRDDAAPWDGPAAEAAALKQALAPGLAPLEVWEVSASSLEDAGYLPGDLLLTAPAAAPRDGDAVLARVYDFERKTARAVLRLYKPPYLITATHHGGTEVTPANGASITAVVVAAARLRETAAA